MGHPTSETFHQIMSVITNPLPVGDSSNENVQEYLKDGPAAGNYNYVALDNYSVIATYVVIYILTYQQKQ